MAPETRQCKNCARSFVIEPDDFAFYQKISVPQPTLCPECRLIRRLAFVNVSSLYKRLCAKCGKPTMTMFAPDPPAGEAGKKDLTVWCMPCWWADDWDGREYTMDYDPARSFLDQVDELARKTPWQALEAQYLTLTNSEYTNAIAHAKNCYLVFWADYCENVLYSYFLNGLKDSADCYRMKESELCYEDVGCSKCYRTFFSEECDSCTDTWFSRACAGCMNCFGCVNLRNKSYCIWNEQYTKEEYLAKLKEFNLTSRRAVLDLQKKAEEFWLKYPHRAYIGNSLNVNVSGDYIYESKNTYDAYLVSGAEDSRYIQFVSVAPARDCYDYSGWGNEAERIYESAVVGEGASNVKFCDECWPCSLDNEYSLYAIACKHVLGCVNLKRKMYCILNKEYSPADYTGLKGRIITDMKARGEYGEKHIA